MAATSDITGSDCIIKQFLFKSDGRLCLVLSFENVASFFSGIEEFSNGNGRSL